MTTARIEEPLYLGFYTPEDLVRFENYRTQWDAPPGPVDFHRVHGPVARINIYVGANNSGKSRLLRALLHAQPTAGLLASARDLRAKAIADLKSMSDHFPPSGGDVLVRLINSLQYRYHQDLVPERVAWMWSELERWPLHTLLSDPSLTRDSVVHKRVMPPSQRHTSIALQFKLLRSLFPGDEWEQDAHPHEAIPFESLEQQWPHMVAFDQVLDRRITVPPAPKVYIPVLRSAHTLHGCSPERDAAGDIFLKTVVENYGIQVTDEAPSREVFTGLQLYEQVLRDRCGPKATRERIDAFEEFLGERFFGGQSVEIVSRYTTDRAEQHINVKIGAREERALHDLGDGINALILVLYKIFTADPGTWIFIEEPELNLHPGLQRIFLETLLHEPSVRERDLRVFFTTHSNHLVGMAMHHPGDVAVFALTPETEDASRFLVRTVQGPELGLLDELGVDNASVFLANCSLWVEGPSDRIYLRAFLQAYARAEDRQLREDLDFAFFEYGGSNFKHYAFDAGAAPDTEKIRAQFVANRVFLLADRDDDPTKYTHLEAAAGPGGGSFEFATTAPAREIENLLSIAALKAIFHHQRETIDRHLLKDIDPDALPWDAITDAERLESRFAGTFSKLLAGTAAAGILFKNKKTALASAFARAVEDGQITWDDLGSEAQKLTRQIGEFIARHNPGRGATSPG